MPPSPTRKTRVRNMVQRRLASTRTHRVNAGVVTDTFTAGQLVSVSGSYESVLSVGHKGPPYDEGGAFRVDRFSIDRGVSNVETYGRAVITPTNILETRITGPSIQGTTNSNVVTYVNDGYPVLFKDADLLVGYNNMSLPSANLNTYGATALSRFSPLKPGASVGQLIGETFRDGLPHNPIVLLKKLKDFKGLGQNYLNVEFGWLPFLNDLRQLYKTWNTLDSRMAQIIRDNGRPIRRSGNLKTTVTNVTTNEISPSTTTSSLEGFSLFAADSSPQSPVHMKKTVTTSERVWFSGRMRYFIPDTSSSQWSSKAKLALFGLNPTPSLLYELMPWSWLIDWFTNLGDIISNFSDNGIADLVIDYGYVMRHYKRVTTYSTMTNGLVKVNNSPGLSAHSPQKLYTTTIVEESKERAVATPFGFGLTIGSLSARQIAILAAIDATRGTGRKSYFDRF